MRNGSNATNTPWFHEFSPTYFADQTKIHICCCSLAQSRPPCATLYTNYSKQTPFANLPNVLDGIINSPSLHAADRPQWITGVNPHINKLLRTTPQQHEVRRAAKRPQASIQHETEHGNGRATRGQTSNNGIDAKKRGEEWGGTRRCNIS